MSHRPTIDTLEAKRALEEAGLDSDLAEILLRLIDTGVHNCTIDRAALEALRKDFVIRQVSDFKWNVILIGVLASAVTLFQFGANVF